MSRGGATPTPTPTPPVVADSWVRITDSSSSLYGNYICIGQVNGVAGTPVGIVLDADYPEYNSYYVIAADDANGANMKPKDSGVSAQTKAEALVAIAALYGSTVPAVELVENTDFEAVMDTMYSDLPASDSATMRTAKYGQNGSVSSQWPRETDANVNIAQSTTVKVTGGNISNANVLLRVDNPATGTAIVASSVSNTSIVFSLEANTMTAGQKLYLVINGAAFGASLVFA